jgi:beta-galactosidase
MDLQHVRITAVDSKGRRVRSCNDLLTFSLTGDARLVAVTNGDMTSDELNTRPHRRLWQGTAMAIIRAGRMPSMVTMTARSPYMTTTTKLETK